MFLPKKKDLDAFCSFRMLAFNDMPGRMKLRDMGRDLSDDEKVALCQLQGAVRLLGKLGALRPEWLEKNNLLPDFHDVDPI